MGLEAVPLFFGALAFGFIVAGTRMRQTAGRLPAHWLAVTGTVVDAERPQLVTYLTPDGRRVQLRGTLDPSYAVGQDVAVLVDPVDSTRARLVDADRAAVTVARTFLVIGAICLVLTAGSFVVFA